MANFTKDDLYFVEELPKHVEIECPVCYDVMLTDPHLVTCCGHHFCGTCIKRIKVSDDPCPMCKEINYQAFVDKSTLRIINGLQVYCFNKEIKDGCKWKGELKNLSAHLNEGEREGECWFEEVNCQYCDRDMQRRRLFHHEKNRCSLRPYKCQYCPFKGTYVFINNKHYKDCQHYPVSCPLSCSDKSFPRHLTANHLAKECPLQPVECPFNWAGCTDMPCRKDIQKHSSDIKHMSLLAVACGQLKKENEELSATCSQLKIENDKASLCSKEENEKLSDAYIHLTAAYTDLKETNSAAYTHLKETNTTAYTHLKKKHEELSSAYTHLRETNTTAYTHLKNKHKELSAAYTHFKDTNTTAYTYLKKRHEDLSSAYTQLREKHEKLEKQVEKIHEILNAPLDKFLPITVTFGSIDSTVHAYTHNYGHHISILAFNGWMSRKIFLAFHKGKFDKYYPEMPKISIWVPVKRVLIPLLTNTRATFKKTDHDSLKTSTRDTPNVLSVTVPSSVPSSVQIVAIWDYMTP